MVWAASRGAPPARPSVRIYRRAPGGERKGTRFPEGVSQAADVLGEGGSALIHPPYDVSCRAQLAFVVASSVLCTPRSLSPFPLPLPFPLPPPVRPSHHPPVFVLLRPPPMTSHRRPWAATLAFAGLIATAVASAAPSAASASPGDAIGECDVAVIGAGIGGLYSAWRLATAGRKAGVRPERVCVFEATGRTGGRILTLRGKEALPAGYDGYTVDMGTSG